MTGDDIVAFLIDGRIVRELQGGDDVHVITRDHMKFMAACDLGPRWKDLAEAPAIATVKPGIEFGTLSRLVL